MNDISLTTTEVRRFNLVTADKRVEVAYHLLVLCARSEYKSQEATDLFLDACRYSAILAPGRKPKKRSRALLLKRTVKRRATRAALEAYLTIFAVVAHKRLYDWYYRKAVKSEIKVEPQKATEPEELPF